MRLLKKTPPDQTLPKMIINSRGAVAIDPEAFLDSGVVQGQLKALQELEELEAKLANEEPNERMAG